MGLETLPTIATPYPSIQPTYDISSCLTNGCEPWTEGSVMATIEGNHVFWDVRINTSNAIDHDNRRFLHRLPEELWLPVGAIRPGMHGNEATTVQWHRNGWVFLEEPGRLLSQGHISFEARTIRRPA